MHPLTVTWPPLIPTDRGRANMTAWLKAGFANHTHYPNQRLSKILAKIAFENLLHPFQPFTIGQKNLAPKVALMHNIKLIFYGEHEAERGSPVSATDTSKRDLGSFSADLGKDLDIYMGGVCIPDLLREFKFEPVDFFEYLPADRDKILKGGVEFHYLGYFEEWHPQDVFYRVLKCSDFMPNDLRTEGSYSKYSSIDDKMDWLHYYCRYIKFGQGRATSDSSHEIREGVITREEGKLLVERFDGEFPKLYLNEILDYMDIKIEKFIDIVDSFRPNHLWANKNGEWVLRHPIWQEKGW